MLVKELMALLEECDPDAPVFHCDQEFTYSFRGITTHQECRDEFSKTSVDGDAPNDVSIVQEGQLCPGPANAWTAARRRLLRVELPGWPTPALAWGARAILGAARLPGAITARRIDAFRGGRDHPRYRPRDGRGSRSPPGLRAITVVRPRRSAQLDLRGAW